MERYGLYGVIAQEREVNERGLTLEEQNVGDTGGELLYETNDEAEARAIYEAGGFARGGIWHVVTRVEDRTKHPVTFGKTPSAASHALVRPVPNKRDYDQG